jgi:DNA-binding CsgD family transcriptional regulator
MHDRDRLDDALRQTADLRVRSAQVRAKADRIMAKSRQLITEHEVVVCIARGETNAEISVRLFMSVATVKAHITHILTKLGLTNRTQIALLAHDAEHALGVDGAGPRGDRHRRGELPGRDGQGARRAFGEPYTVRHQHDPNPWRFLWHDIS